MNDALTEQVEVPVPPDQIQAVVVGLGEYREAGWRLPGAAADAIEFAFWLRNCGVPADNIRLLASGTVGDDLDRRLNLVGLDVRPVTRLDDVREVFVNNLSGCNGSVLYVYWGGHGGMPDDGSRVLFTPDATEDDPRCVSGPELCSYLTGAPFVQFRTQILVFDTCARYLDSRRTVAPKPTAFPRARRHEGVTQVQLYAAEDGQVADDDPRERSFTKLLLKELPAKAGAVIDLAVVPARLRDRMDDYFKNAPQSATPICVYLKATGQDAVEERFTPGNAPPMRILTEVSRAVRRACPIEDERHRTMSDVLTFFHARLDRMDDLGFAQFLLCKPRALATLAELIVDSDGDSDKIERLLDLTLRHPVPGLLSVPESHDLKKILEVACPKTSPLLGSILPVVLPYAAIDEPFLNQPTTPQRVLECVEYLEDMPFCKRGQPPLWVVPPVLTFVEYLAASHRCCVLEPLRQWSDKVARRLQVARGLRERRHDAEQWADYVLTQGTVPVRVVVWLFPDQLAADGTSPRHECMVWTDPGSGQLRPFGASDNGQVLDNYKIFNLIDAAVNSLSVDERVTVEVVLPIEMIAELDVARWEAAPPKSSLRLGVRHPLALRCAPLGDVSEDEDERRRSRELRLRWPHRSEHPPVSLGGQHVTPDSLAGALQRDPHSAWVVVQIGGDRNGDLVRAALNLGYPLVLWDYTGCGELPQTHFKVLGVGDGTIPHLADLPERLRHYRACSQVEPALYPMRPGLVLDDIDRPLPQPLALVDPTVL